MDSKNIYRSLFIFILLAVLVLTGFFIYFSYRKYHPAKERIYQVNEIEENIKLSGKEIKLQAVVFLVSEIDKTQFYVVDLKYAEKLNSPECGVYNVPVIYKGDQPKPKSKIEITGKSSGLFSNGTLKFEAKTIKVLN